MKDVKDLLVGILVVAVLLLGAGTIFAPVNVNVTIDSEEPTGAQSGPDVYKDMYFHGSVALKAPVVSIAKTSVYSTTTVLASQSNSIFTHSASGTTMTLPAVTFTGATYRFTVGGALDTGNLIIDSLEGDNIEGTLLVAGAVVDCVAEDQINFVTDGENVGDYVELYTNGTNWLIGDSGFLTAAKGTCTDPS